MKHENQFAALSENVGQTEIFLNFRRSLKDLNLHLISDFVDKLNKDHNRFVSDDGNVFFFKLIFSLGSSCDSKNT